METLGTCETIRFTFIRQKFDYIYSVIVENNTHFINVKWTHYERNPKSHENYYSRNTIKILKRSVLPKT